MKAEEVPVLLIDAAKAAIREQVDAAPGHVSARLAERIARATVEAVLQTPLLREYGAAVLDAEADRQEAEVAAIEAANRLTPDAVRSGYIGGARGAIATTRDRAARLRGTTTEGSGA